MITTISLVIIWKKYILTLVSYHIKNRFRISLDLDIKGKATGRKHRISSCLWGGEIFLKEGTQSANHKG